MTVCCQVVHCGPDDTFAASLRGNVGVAVATAPVAPGSVSAGDSGAPKVSSPSGTAAVGASGASGSAAGGSAGAGAALKELNWAAGPSMEVALLKQSERNVSELDEGEGGEIRVVV